MVVLVWVLSNSGSHRQIQHGSGNYFELTQWTLEDPATLKIAIVALKNCLAIK